MARRSARNQMRSRWGPVCHALVPPQDVKLVSRREAEAAEWPLQQGGVDKKRLVIILKMSQVGSSAAIH